MPLYNPPVAGNTGSLSAGTTRGTLGEVVLSNSNGLAFGMSGQTVTGSYTVPSIAGLLSNIRVSAGTTSNLLSAVTFATGNGITFGLDAGTITASHNGLTSQSGQAFSAGGGSSAFQTLSFSNANGISFSNNAGQVQASYTVPTVTNSSMSVSDAATSGTLARLAFTNLNGVTLSLSSGAGGSHTIVGSHNALTSQSNQNVTAANGGFAFQTLSFSNLNGISFGTSAGSAITASHNAITTGRASTDAIGLNTAQTNVTWTANSSGISINAGGYAGTGTSATNASITLNSNGLAISVAAPGGGGETRLTAYAVSNTTQSSTGTIPLSSLQFAGAGIASVGISNGSVIVSVPAGGGGGDGGVFAGVSTGGNTAGSTGTVSTGNFVLVGSRGITLSQSTGAAGSAATVSILGPAPGSYFIPPWFQGVGSNFWAQTQYPGNGSVNVFPVDIGHDLVLSKFLASVSLSISSSSNSSHGGTLSIGMGIYTRNASTLSLVSSALGTYAWTNTSNNSTASLSGVREVSGSFAGQVSLTPGDYWVGFWSRTSTVNANWYTASNVYALTGGSNSTHSGDFAAAAAVASFQPGLPGQGTFSATSAALPASMAFSDITGTARFFYRPLFAMRNFS